MKRRFFITGSRKITMVIIYIIIGIISSFFMQLQFYEKFLYYLLLMIMGFFGGNAVEHIAGIFKKESYNELDEMNK